MKLSNVGAPSRNCQSIKTDLSGNSKQFFLKEKVRILGQKSILKHFFFFAKFVNIFSNVEVMHNFIGGEYPLNPFCKLKMMKMKERKKVNWSSSGVHYRLIAIP